MKGRKWAYSEPSEDIFRITQLAASVCVLFLFFCYLAYLVLDSFRHAAPIGMPPGLYSPNILWVKKCTDFTGVLPE